MEHQAALDVSGVHLLTDTEVGILNLGSAEASLSSLPSEIWAVVLGYVSFGSIGHCVAATKYSTTLLEALRSIHSLYIDHPSQLRSRGQLVEHLTGVRDIYILSFANQRPNDGELDKDTATMTVPFVTRFPCLESVSFGQIDSSGLQIFAGFHPNLTPENRECIRSLIDAFCSAFKYGDLPAHLAIRGLYCPRVLGDWIHDPGCQCCRRLYNAFPIPQALDSDACLPYNERIDIISARQGGLAYLNSERWFFQLLSFGRCHVMQLQYSVPLTFHSLRYEQGVISEMERLIRNNSVDTKNMDPRVVSLAIMKSFLPYDGIRAPPEELCYIEEPSFVQLRGMGLPIAEEDFLTPFVQRVEHLPIAINRMVGDSRDLQHVSAVQIAHHFLSQPYYAGVAQQLVDSAAVPTAVQLLQSDDSRLQSAASCMCCTIAYAKDKYSEAIVDAGGVPHLVHLLGSADYSCYSNATAAIAHILRFCPGRRELILQAGVMEPLMHLLQRSEDDFMVNWGTKALVDLCRVEPLELSVILPTTRLLCGLLFKLDKDETALSNILRALVFLLRQKPKFLSDTSLFHDGILDRLVELLDHRSLNDVVRWGACDALEILVSNVPSIDDRIINGISTLASPRLLNFLSNGDDGCKQSVCCIIEYMVEDDPDRITLFISANYTQPLIEAINKGSLSQYKVKFCLRALCGIIAADDVDIDMRLQALLGVEAAMENLSMERSSEAARALIDAGICTSLENFLLRDKAASMWRCCALKVLGHLLSKDSFQALGITGDVVLPSLLQLILDRRVGIQENVCWAVNCIIKDDNNALELIEAGMLTPMTTLLGRDHLRPDVAKSASRAILKMVHKGLSGKLITFHDSLRPLSAMLAMDILADNALDILALAYRAASREDRSEAIRSLVNTGLYERIVALLSGDSASHLHASLFLNVDICHAVWLSLGSEPLGSDDGTSRDASIEVEGGLIFAFGAGNNDATSAGASEDEATIASVPAPNFSGLDAIPSFDAAGSASSRRRDAKRKKRDMIMRGVMLPDAGA